MKKKLKAVLISALMICILAACGDSDTHSTKQSQTTETSQSVTNVAKKKDVDGLGWGAVVSFGSYEQDNNTGNGKEPIEWIVLEVQNDKMLLLSKYVLDASYFDEKQEVAFWDTCTLRTWLNDSFLNNAFNDKQQQAIVLSETTTSDGYIPNTQNKVFLLSKEEIEQYFQIAWGESGHFYDNSLKAEPTEFALAKGLKLDDNKRVDWFLRSPGKYSDDPYAYVSSSGSVTTMYRNSEKFLGIRPAVWVDLNADFELLQKESANTEASLEDVFPLDWEGRYVILEKENSAEIYCKMAYESSEQNMSLLFSIYYITGNMELPEYIDLGTYNDYPVQAFVPWEVPAFSSNEIAEEYTDMIYDVGGILDAIEDRIAELEHFRQVETYGFDLSAYGSPKDKMMTGVYQLDCSSWSEESKKELLGEYNHSSFISINPDGEAYLSLGSHEPQKGTVLVAKNIEALPEDEPVCILWFDDGIIKYAYYLQGTLTIHGMEDVQLNGDAPKGLSGSEWTYNWVSDEFWTEESLRDDIG